MERRSSAAQVTGSPHAIPEGVPEDAVLAGRTLTKTRGALLPFESLKSSAMSYPPVAVALPLMVPVAGSKLKPGGRKAGGVPIDRVAWYDGLVHAFK